MSSGTRDVVTPALMSAVGGLSPELQAQLSDLLKVQKEAAEYDLRARKETEAVKAEAKKQDEEARRQNALAAKKEMEDKERLQTNCWHIRLDGKSNLGGQWSWNREQVTLVCGSCGMIDTNTKSALMAKYGPNRYPKDENMGGPEMGGMDNLA